VADIFEEVEGQLRSDRYKTLAFKSLPWVLGVLLLALAVALGVWGWREYRSNASEKASETYQAALDAFNQGKTDEAVRLWGDVAESPSKVYRALALMQQGGVRLAARDTAGAVKLFDEAAEAAPSNAVADAARLKSAFALLDTASLKEMEARLKPMMEEGRPYRGQAREALAFAKLQAGDMTGAREDFVVLSLLADSPQSARERAQAAIEMIDSGAAKAIPAIVKAAAALPPPIEMPPGAAPPVAGAPVAPQPQAPGTQ
jgi:hypothetical protein